MKAQIALYLLPHEWCQNRTVVEKVSFHVGVPGRLRITKIAKKLSHWKTGQHMHTTGNVQGRKNFSSYSQTFSPWNLQAWPFWQHNWAIRESFLHEKSYFHHVTFFSLKTFPLYGTYNLEEFSTRMIYSVTSFNALPHVLHSFCQCIPTCTRM